MHIVDSQCVSHFSTTNYRQKPVLAIHYFSKKLNRLIPKIGKGVIPPPPPPPPSFPEIQEIQDAPTFYGPIGKTKVLCESYYRVVYNFYPQSILILEEYLQKW